MLMPVSGGMGGVSIARPLDVQSTLGGNPATLAGFRGTQFSFGGGWVEPTISTSHGGGVLPGIGAFRAKSEAEGTALGNIAITEDLRDVGLPMTIGIGLLGTSGLGVSYRDVPASNGTSLTLQVLAIAAGAGIDVTDRLKIGADLSLGTATLDGPFTGLTSAAYDYALRGKVGLACDIGGDTTLGIFYQTQQKFNFDNAVIFDFPMTTNIQDIDMDLPDNIGFGIANNSLVDGRLLLAVDVLFKQWENAAFWDVFFENQWVFQAGAQYEASSGCRLRCGYVYAENPTRPPPGVNPGVVLPPAVAAGISYVQSQVTLYNRHRFTFGFGMQDVLPGVDMDLFAGFMPRASQSFGTSTSTSIESYWLGTGLTWRFGAASGSQ
jgi:long-chain fatty acid transport protein